MKKNLIVFFSGYRKIFKSKYLGRALDLILTGRKVVASEAYQMGLINRICDPGEAIDTAVKLARDIIENPLVPMLNDRKSLYENLESKNIDEAIEMEMKNGEDSVNFK